MGNPLRHHCRARTVQGRCHRGGTRSTGIRLCTDRPGCGDSRGAVQRAGHDAFFCGWRACDDEVDTERRSRIACANGYIRECVMDTDLMLVLGISLGVLSIPSMVSAFTDGRAPRFAAVMLLIAGTLLVMALVSRPERLFAERGFRGLWEGLGAVSPVAVKTCLAGWKGLPYSPRLVTPRVRPKWHAKSRDQHSTRRWKCPR